MPTDPRNATLIARRDLDGGNTVFTVRPDRPLRFTAGQWTEMGLPRVDPGEIGPSGDEYVKDGVVRRAYSICSIPDSPELEFYFNRVEEGQLTRWLWNLAPGDRLYIDPETRGHFTLDAIPSVHTRDILVEDLPPENRPDILFVATGTGLAPFASMVRHFTNADTIIPWRRLTLVHGVRHRALLAWEDDLRALASDPRNRFSYIPTLTREPETSAWDGSRGRVTQIVRELLREFAAQPSANTGPESRPLNLSTLHAFLCGNATMIAAVEGDLMPHGLVPRWQDPSGSIHTEVYY